jgi:tRNA (guanine37-N1)-methyltransferase
MEIGVITLFPEMFTAINYGITGRAVEKKIINLHFWNPRDYTKNKHRTVDDRPYGGGPGMLMKAQPLQDAIRAAKKKLTYHSEKNDNKKTKVIYVSPQGRKFNHKLARETAAACETIIFVAGRYEGIDERLFNTDIDEEWSIGDYVLTGGELPIMVIIDSITRLLPGALGDEMSAQQDSFAEGLLDYPHYTRPEVLNDLGVPKVLLSGDHKEIEKWRLKQALGKTWLKRPELLQKIQLNKLQQSLLEEFIKEHNRGKKK